MVVVSRLTRSEVPPDTDQVMLRLHASGSIPIVSAGPVTGSSVTGRGRTTVRGDRMVFTGQVTKSVVTGSGRI